MDDKSHKAKETVEVNRVELDEHYQLCYGITLDAYEKMVRDRKGTCDICKCVNKGWGVPHRLVMDCTPGVQPPEIRGLICTRCKMMIDMLDKRSDWVKACLDYVDAEN